MEMQLGIVALAVLAAGCYLVWSAWRTWSGKKSHCGGGCSCGKEATSAEKNSSRAIIPVEQITLRRRAPLPSDHE